MRGAGTQENPFIIETPADLQAIQNNLSAYYELANDIDMTGVNWTPIAPDSTNRFTGTIDGKGHKILNFTINDTTKDQQAFIVWTNAGATFKNIGFENAYVKGRNYNCVFVARPYMAVFENCYVTGRIEGTSYNAGFSYASSNATYRNCFVDVTVNGSYAGAFVSVDNQKTVFEQCYSNANVPFIQKPNTNSGYQTTYSYCRFNKTKYNGTNQNGLNGLTDTQMKQQSSFVGWDFENVWYMPENDYPKLRVFLGIKQQTINLQSYINPIQSKITRVNKSTKQIQSFTDNLQSLTSSKRVKKYLLSTYISPIETSVQKSNRTVRSVTQHVTSYINPIGSIVERKTKTIQQLLSYINPIQSNVSVIAPIRNKVVNAYVSIIENPSIVLYSDNNSDLNIIENPTTVQFDDNLSNTYAIENPSTVEVIN
ncbi:hypothetical protein GTID1_13150 [Geobacillus thermodenitrificans]|uniref:hypothetical protein n=1 Tax=Geobacillus thermodenitrificans TaxID=33940 RepID=UPI000C0597BF|nr:hypothetical protein [Geobacillus thermodenitrificans]ATO38042.1 hypothetical protein GTID1_13150 [Geobacillus thermodenitrificans]